MFRIGEFAALTRVSRRMLRHYDEIGLLRPDSIDSRTGYRGYSPAQLPRLNRIIALKELGFGLEEVARLLDAKISVDEMRVVLERRREELEHRVRADQGRLTQIANRLRAIERDERFPLGDVVVRPVADALMATLRTVVHSLGKPVEHLFDEAEAYVARYHARLDASPLMLFHETSRSEELDVEVAIPLEHPIPSAARISVRQIPGCDTMACVVYAGGYHQTEHAVRTLREWAGALRWSPRGAVREVYLRFGADNADALRLPPRFLADREADYVTEVQLPVAAASPPGRRMKRATLAAAIIALASAPEAAQAQDSPCEAPLAGVSTTCAWVNVDGRYRVRSIVTRPANLPRDQLPALLFVQWLSCDPVTVTPHVSDGWQDVLRALIQRSGMIVARTEKPGLGGSGGPACEELGYDEEVLVHRAALEQLRRAAGVDPDSIFIFGGSMGGTIAPQLASELGGTGMRGVVVAGTTAGTWLEHMIALDRRVMELRGLRPDTVHALMPEHVRFHAAYLAQARPPAQVATDWGGARAVWRRMIGTDTLLLRQYGRPVRFHHEAQRSNWPGAWAAVRAPVLVIHGEYDWIMPEDEHLRITRSLSPAIRSRATYVKVPGMGHDFMIYPSPEDSFRGRNGRFDAAVADTILGWLRARRRG